MECNHSYDAIIFFSIMMSISLRAFFMTIFHLSYNSRCYTWVIIVISGTTGTNKYPEQWGRLQAHSDDRVRRV